MFEAADRLFNLVRDREQAEFVAEASRQLHADRKAVSAHVKGQRDRRLSCGVVETCESPERMQAFHVQVAILAVGVEETEADRRLEQSRAQNEIELLEKRFDQSSDCMNVVD